MAKNVFLTNSRADRAVRISEDSLVDIRINTFETGSTLSLRTNWVTIDDWETGTVEALQAKAADIMSQLGGE
jgi:hypothetical protein